MHACVSLSAWLQAALQAAAHRGCHRLPSHSQRAPSTAAEPSTRTVGTADLGAGTTPLGLMVVVWVLMVSLPATSSSSGKLAATWALLRKTLRKPMSGLLLLGPICSMCVASGWESPKMAAAAGAGACACCVVGARGAVWGAGRSAVPALSGLATASSGQPRRDERPWGFPPSPGPGAHAARPGPACPGQPVLGPAGLPRSERTGGAQEHDAALDGQRVVA